MYIYKYIYLAGIYICAHTYLHQVCQFRMTNGALNVHSNQRKTDKYIKTELFEFDMFSRLVQAKKSYDKRRDLSAFPS